MTDWEEMDRYLKGESYRGFDCFGAHPAWENGQTGARVNLYAPNARQVQLVGTFNDWNGRPLTRLENGVWTGFAPGAQEGQLYKYRIQTADGSWYDRADPFAFASERRPQTASILTRLDGYQWGDGEWMARRDKNYNRPMSIYELHAGSWRRPGGNFPDYRELARELVPYLKEQGFTHLELLPLTEHPLDASWGYQVSGYFSATSRYGSPHALMSLVDACHQAGIGVILDFVPVHFVRDFHGLHLLDGSPLYESEDESLRYSQWDTALFDFTKPHVVSFLKSALNFWLGVYHFDGIRYDAVSNLIYRNGRREEGENAPGQWFLRSANYGIQQLHPNAMLIAEDSSDQIKVTAPVVYGGLGFDYKWDLGWMHDTLDYLALPPQQRPARRDQFCFWEKYFSQNIYLLPFSHDEVVHGKGTLFGKMWGSREDKWAQLRCLMLYQLTRPGKTLNFMGNELAQEREWSEERPLDWELLEQEDHRAFSRYFARLQRLYRELPALWKEDYHPESFAWLEPKGGNPAVFAYRRSDRSGQQVTVVLNLSGQAVLSLRVPVSGPESACLRLATWEDAARPRLCPGPGGWEAQLSLPRFGGVLLGPEE